MTHIVIERDNSHEIKKIYSAHASIEMDGDTTARLKIDGAAFVIQVYAYGGDCWLEIKEKEHYD